MTRNRAHDAVTVGDRVTLEIPIAPWRKTGRRRELVTGTVAAVNEPGLPPGVRVVFDQPVNGVPNAYATHAECRSAPNEDTSVESRRWAEAALADQDQRAKLARIAAQTAVREPVRDDFSWLRKQGDAEPVIGYTEEAEP